MLESFTVGMPVRLPCIDGINVIKGLWYCHEEEFDVVIPSNYLNKTFYISRVYKRKLPPSDFNVYAHSGEVMYRPILPCEYFVGLVDDTGRYVGFDCCYRDWKSNDILMVSTLFLEGVDDIMKDLLSRALNGNETILFQLHSIRALNTTFYTNADGLYFIRNRQLLRLTGNEYLPATIYDVGNFNEDNLYCNGDYVIEYAKECKDTNEVMEAVHAGSLHSNNDWENPIPIVKKDTVLYALKVNGNIPKSADNFIMTE